MFLMITTYPNLLKGDTMSRKYRVEQRFTTGWGLVSETSFKLTKDEAKKTLEILMSEGVNPDDLRAIPD